MVQTPTPLAIPITFSAKQARLGDVVTQLGVRYDISVMLEERAAAETVTFDVVDEPLGLVLQLLARLVGAELSQVGDVSYIGTLRNEDRVVLVRKVPRLDVDSINRTVDALKSDLGKYSVTPDGLLVLSDRVDIVERVSRMIDDVRAVPVDTWVVQLHVISLAWSDVKELGLDITPAVDLSALLAASSVATAPESTAQAVASLGVVLQAARQSSSSTVIAEPVVLLRDGGTASVSSGRTDPVPIRVVSPEGTVQTERFDFIDTGFVLDVELRQLRANAAAITIDLTIDEVVGDVEGVPIRSGFDLTAASTITSGGVYLVGSLERTRHAESRTGIFQTAQRDDNSQSVVQVWARAHRIMGPVQFAPDPQSSISGGVPPGALPGPPEAQNGSRSDTSSRGFEGAASRPLVPSREQ